MKGKKILYSIWLKAAAFAVCIATAAAAAGAASEAISGMRNGSGYRPGEAFDESNAVVIQLDNGMYSLVSAVTDSDTSAVFDKTDLDSSGLEYYAENLKTGKVITNTGDKNKSSYSSGGPLSDMVSGLYVTAEKKNNEWSIEGNTAVQNRYLGSSLLIYKDAPPVYSGDSDTEYSEEYAAEAASERVPLDDYVVYLRFSQDKTSEMLTLWQNAQSVVDDALRAIPAYAVLFILAVVYLSFAAGRRAEDDEIHLIAVDRVFLDISALVMAAALILAFLGVSFSTTAPPDDDIYRRYAILAAAAGSAVIVTCWLSIVKHIKNRTFVQNSFVCRAVRWLWRLFVRLVKWVFVKLPGKIKNAYLSLKALAAAKMSYIVMLVVSAVYMWITVLIAWLTGALLYESDSISAFFVVLCLALIAAPVLLIFRTLKGYDGIRDGLKRIRGGETLHKIAKEGSVITDAVAEDINDIGDGLSKAVEQSVRSERMKAELITNVSHDLKTPLTSIINYTDLLMQETLQPEEANDYVKIIGQKSKKLKQLTSDLFDVSKARSGSEELELESIDYKLLVTQSEAELDSEIQKAGLEFVLDLPDGDVRINADGKKLSRVFENLIMNAIKYSLRGTRVYIDLRTHDDICTVEIKNIANYKMNFDDDEITERFVRGDASRTGDGSGLGLAIARSYVELMGGKFYIKTDGDLFKAVIEFRTDTMNG